MPAPSPPAAPPGPGFGGRTKRVALDILPAPIRGRLRVARLRWAAWRFRPRVVEHRYGPARLKVRLIDALGSGWYDHDWEEPPEVAALRAGGALRAGATVFDLGAHQGIVAMMLAEAVGPTGCVVAVEASSSNAAAAETNRDLNGLGWMHVVRAAVADEAGEVLFNRGANGQLDDGTGAWGRESVPAVTLDGLADRFGAPDAVLLDVEGAEQRALAGATRTLAGGRGRGGASFVVEVHGGHGLETLGGSVRGVLSFFPADRFTLSARPAEGDGEFRPVRGEPPAGRFFLHAARRTTGAGEGG